jgi:predicted dehydrogenase/NADPH:quinone reductase-like Zn-dependent oxidoreductase
MKILTQNLKTGKTDILEVPSPSISSKKIRVKNDYSLISTGTESSIVNFGKASWLNKARQQPDRVKDVINKVKSSGITDTYKAIRNKLYYPMVMGYAAVGTVTHKNKNFNLSKGMRVFTNSCHQEEALVDYNMCVKIPDNVDSKSASFGAIGGIAMQSIKCIPDGSKFVAIIGLGLLGQVTLRILNALGYKCIVYDVDSKKVDLAEKYGGKKVENNITEEILNHTKGVGVDCTIIAASSLSNQIINEAPSYTRRKGRIISSGLVGLNLIRDKFFKKQVELVVSNSSGDKNHRGKGSSYENINYFFKLLSLEKISVLDLVSEEVSFDDADNIYSFPDDSLFFSKLIRYKNNEYPVHTFSSEKENKSLQKLKVGLIGTGNFAMSTLIPTINNTNDGYLHSLLGREGLSLYLAKKRFYINKITTNENDFYEDIDVAFISTPHQTHFNLSMKAIELSLPVWIEKPLVISIKELKAIQQKMYLNKLIYAVGYNRSSAPWTNFMINKINSRKTNISMTINAGQLPADHWLLDENNCGGRILGECCHFIDLALTLLSHTKLIRIDCVERDRYYQDTGSYILAFEDESKVDIHYKHDLPASIPKERIVVKFLQKTYTNNNWKKFSVGNFFNLEKPKKGKGHHEAISNFFQRIKNNRVSTENEINDIVFSTYIAIKLQKMSKGDSLNIFDCYKDEILSNPLNTK